MIAPHFQIEYLVIWMLWSLNIQNQSRPFFLKQHGTTFLGFLYRKAILELKKSKNQDFLKNRCCGRKTFLGPN